MSSWFIAPQTYYDCIPILDNTHDGTTPLIMTLCLFASSYARALLSSQYLQSPCTQLCTILSISPGPGLWHGETLNSFKSVLCCLRNFYAFTLYIPILIFHLEPTSNGPWLNGHWIIQKKCNFQWSWFINCRVVDPKWSMEWIGHI